MKGFTESMPWNLDAAAILIATIQASESNDEERGYHDTQCFKSIEYPYT